jgi:hypothetical protein
VEKEEKWLAGEEKAALTSVKSTVEVLSGQGPQLVNLAGADYHRGQLPMKPPSAAVNEIGHATAAPTSVEHTANQSEYEEVLKFGAEEFARVQAQYPGPGYVKEGKRDIVIIAAWRRPEFLLM